MTRTALLLSLAAALPVYAADPVAIEKTTTTTETTTATTVDGKPAVVLEKGSLTTVINDSVSFSTLKAALVASGLDVTLGTKGAYTVLAPTDEAFDKLPAGTLGKLMMPENKEKLRSLLLYHVIAGKVLAAEMKDGEVKTMNGEKIKVDVESDKIEVNDSKVFSSDVAATNGVMHSIGTVLLPKSLDGFAGIKVD